MNFLGKIKRKKDCNCKRANNVNELNEIIKDGLKPKKIGIYTKLSILIKFHLIKFIEVWSASYNFMKNGQLLPIIPDWLSRILFNEVSL